VSENFDFGGVVTPPLLLHLSAAATETAAIATPNISTTEPDNYFNFPRDNPETKRKENTHVRGIYFIPLITDTENDDIQVGMYLWSEVWDKTKQANLYIPIAGCILDCIAGAQTYVAVDNTTYQLPDTIVQVTGLPTFLDDIPGCDLNIYSPGSDDVGMCVIPDISHVVRGITFDGDLDGHTSTVQPAVGYNFLVGGVF